MLSVLVDNSVIKTRADKPSDKERIEMYSFLEKGEADSKNSVSDVEPLYDNHQGPKVIHHKKNARCIVTGICLAAVIIGVIASLGLLAYKLSTLGHSSNEEQPKVLLSHYINTTNGFIHGVLEDEVHVFKGIPYAIPPVGKYRWKPPMPVDTQGNGYQNEAFEANTFPEKCFQYRTYFKDTIGSEDCLYLNIWSPSVQPDASLPVMVYIHGGGTETKIGRLYGGGLFSGSGHESGMMPDAEIAKTSKMVYVSLNYRLGPFGFLAVNVIDPETKEKITGNYGFMDQVLALKWINMNIKNFGGDPNKVTVFGTGAGATSIFALLASNRTGGLFQRAWLASPSPHLETNITSAFSQNQEILDKLRMKNKPCDGVSSALMYQCLIKLSPEDIINALPMDKWSNPHFRDLPSITEKPIALAIIDGKFLKQPISKIWHQPEGSSFPHVSMLIGSTAQEVDDWPYPTNLATWNWNNYDEYVSNRFLGFKNYVHDLVEEALKLYPHTISPEYQLSSMITDIRQVCGVSYMSKLIATKWSAPVYRYIATYQPIHKTSNKTASGFDEPIRQDDYSSDQSYNNIVPGFRYAYHGIDMEYFFAERNPNKRDRDFINNIRTAVFQFVKNGSIKGWEQFPNKTSVISSQIKYLESYKKEQCRLWIQNLFLPHHSSMN